MDPGQYTTRRDLRIAAEQLIGTFTDRLAGIVIFAAISTVDKDPKMLEVFGAKYVYPWRRSAAEAVQRGIDRGDFPTDTDIEYIVDLFAGMVFQRALVLPEPKTEGIAEKLVATVLPDK